MRKLAVALLLGNPVFFRAATKITLQRTWPLPLFACMMHHTSDSLDLLTHRSQRSFKKKGLKFAGLIAVAGTLVYMLKTREKPIATCSKKSLKTLQQVSETPLAESKQTLDQQTTENFNRCSPLEACNESSTYFYARAIDSNTHHQDEFLCTPFSEMPTKELQSNQSSEIFEETISQEYDSFQNDPYKEFKIKNCIDDEEDKTRRQLSEFMSVHKLSQKDLDILIADAKQILFLATTQTNSRNLQDYLLNVSPILFNFPFDTGYGLIEFIICKDEIPHTIFSILFSKKEINWNNRNHQGISYFELALKEYGNTNVATKKEKLKWILLHLITNSQVSLELHDVKSCENGLKILKTEEWIQKALKQREDFALLPEYIKSFQYVERLEVQKNLNFKKSQNSKQSYNHIENVSLIETSEADNPVLFKKRNVKNR